MASFRQTNQEKMTVFKLSQPPQRIVMRSGVRILNKHIKISGKISTYSCIVLTWRSNGNVLVWEYGGEATLRKQEVSNISYHRHSLLWIFSYRTSLVEVSAQLSLSFAKRQLNRRS